MNKSNRHQHGEKSIKQQRRSEEEKIRREEDMAASWRNNGENERASKINEKRNENNRKSSSSGEISCGNICQHHGVTWRRKYQQYHQQRNNGIVASKIGINGESSMGAASGENDESGSVAAAIMKNMA